MIKGAIFDVDGTLLDSMWKWESALEEYLFSLNIEFKKEDLEKVLYMTTKETTDYLNETFNLNKNAEEIKQGIFLIMENFYKNDAETKKGVINFLNLLKEKNIPMVIATSTEKYMIKMVFERLGIAEYFLDILTCTDLKTSKESSYIYDCGKEIIENKLGYKIKNSDIFVFEDILMAIKALKNSNYTVVAIEDDTSENNRNEIKKISDYYIKDYTEINKIIF